MADLIQYKCPNCAGTIGFDATVQKMKCPYCDTEFDLETLKELDEQLEDIAADDLNWENKPDSVWKESETEGMSVYVCQSCGGEVIGDSTLGATNCPYCGNAVVMKGKFAGGLRPDLVIPFKKTSEDAKAAYLKHLEGKKLLPKVFKSENVINEIKGMYVPVWLFDSDVDADINYNATKVRTWEDANYRYKETSYYKLLRSGGMGFNDIPVDGSTKMPDELMESIEPFDCKDGVDFQTAYLAGYLADRYDVEAKDSEARANERIKHSTEAAFAKTVSSYNTYDIENESIRYSNSRYRYALYPVWIMSTTWNNESFTFIMNGQTGKMAGNLPMDKGLLGKYFCLITAIAAAVMCLIFSII